MVACKAVRAPTNTPLPDSLRVPCAPGAFNKSLGRLSKASLISLALEWLDSKNESTCAPYLLDNRRPQEALDEDYLWLPAETRHDLRLIYNRMGKDNRVSHRSVVARILDGDWRRGLSLYQLATIDFQHLLDHDDALRWTALRLTPRKDDKLEDLPQAKKRRHVASFPAISATTFLRNLQQAVGPLLKAHYSLRRFNKYSNMSVIRICVVDSPYAAADPLHNSSSRYADASHIVYIALPDSCPYVYVSVVGSTVGSAGQKKRSVVTPNEPLALKQKVLEEIPQTLSKAHHRYSLEPTSLTARSLTVMLNLRGNSGANAANGFYSVFAKGLADDSPIDPGRLTFAQKVLCACDEGNHDDFQQQSNQDSYPLSQISNNIPNRANPRIDRENTRLKVLASSRFGFASVPLRTNSLEKAETEPGLDSFRICLDERLSQVRHRTGNYVRGDPTGQVTLTFNGTHVFSGLKKVFESGGFVPEKLPSWMTGEEGISGGIVMNGKVVNGTGDGISPGGQ